MFDVKVYIIYANRKFCSMYIVCQQGQNVIFLPKESRGIRPVVTKTPWNLLQKNLMKQRGAFEILPFTDERKKNLSN